MESRKRQPGTHQSQPLSLTHQSRSAPRRRCQKPNQHSQHKQRPQPTPHLQQNSPQHQPARTEPNLLTRSPPSLKSACHPIPLKPPRTSCSRRLSSCDPVQVPSSGSSLRTDHRGSRGPDSAIVRKVCIQILIQFNTSFTKSVDHSRLPKRA
jgi:hypothetical protein